MTNEGFELEVNHIIESGPNHIRFKNLFDRYSEGTLSDLRREMMELQRKYENGQKAYKDAYERFNSQIMSVYYLLDMISDAGTHHEKRVVITYLKGILQKRLHNGDPLPLNTDLLPF